MAKPTVLYLSYDGLTDPLGQSQILPYVCGLAHAYNIHIISFEKPDVYQKRKEAIDAVCIQHNLFWHPLPYHKKPPVVSTAYDLFRLWREAKRLHTCLNFSIVHCRSYLTALAGLRLKEKYGIKFIFDMRGFWADERVEGGIWKMSNPVYKSIYKFFKRKERDFLAHADHIITLTHNSKKEIESWKIARSPIKVIPTCTDLNVFDPLSVTTERTEALRKQLGIKSSTFVLLYLGSWGTWYMASSMLRFFELMQQQIPDSVFLIVTNDPKQVPDKPGVITRSVSRNEVPSFIRLATASVFFIQPVFSKKASAATKAGELLAMNVPIVTNAGWGDMEQFISETNCGILVQDLTDEKLGIAVQTLRDKKFPPNLRSIAEQNFDLKKGVEAYSLVYTSLAGKL